MMVLFRRDLGLALGAGGGFGQGLGFFLIIIFLMGIALGPSSTSLTTVLPAIVYVAVLLAGLLSLDRVFRTDFDDGSLVQMQLGPLPMGLVIAIKSFVHWLTSGFAMLIIVPLIGVALGVPRSELLWLMLSLLVGTPALSFIGAIGAALTLSLQRASLIQALITLPLYVPTLIYGTLVAAGGERQFAALALLAGLTLFSIVFGPFIAAKTIERHI